jgi:hypothetical protein
VDDDAVQNGSVAAVVAGTGSDAPGGRRTDTANATVVSSNENAPHAAANETPLFMLLLSLRS